MSLSPVNLLTRLDELKKWQEKQQKRLMQQTRGRSESTGSDCDTIEGLSAFDSINFGTDKAKQSQEQTDKLKKPYLRRGAGLCRFGMSPGDQKRPFSKPIPKKVAKDTINRAVDVTPLNVPDYNIKATWQSVEQNRREADLVTQINKFANADTKRQNVVTADVIVHKNMDDEAVASEQSLYEKALEKELLIFEALEQKAMHSSFSSTNSSVIRILSSTPSKTKPTENEEALRKKTVHFKPNGVTKTLQSLQDGNYEEDASPDSSIDSEDFDFKDTECWSDTVESSESSPSIVSIESSASTCVPKTTDKGTMTEFNEELFRKEQKKMEKFKVQFEKEQREFKQEKKQFEKYVLEEKIKVEFYLEDEKKKLAKEKMVFERYVKDVNNKTTRKEREEISALKSELATVKEAAKLKDTRNATSQARLRNQVKTLEKENANLKDEVEKLLKQNAKLQTAQKFSRKPTDTKMLHEINRNLSKLTKDAKVSEQLSKLGITNTDEVIKKRPIVEHDKSDDSLCENYKTPPKIRHSYEDYKSNGCKENFDSNATDTSLLRNYEMVFGNAKQQNQNVIPPSEVSHSNGKTKFAARNEATLSDRSPEGNVTTGQTRNETTLSDGSTEVTYSNGNVKVVSPDGNFIVMKYFNGDIKETRLLDGVIRYYYSQNQSWHSTYADGSELLEFPNGQTEKKSKDGSSEIAFPNGVVKTISPDGTENISYPDGSRVTVDGRGEKILLLPNGQKEIHTDDHKRREYPDGTVKILYPDGIQETRYNNGRIRIKDKAGKLLLDSFDENT